MNNKDPIKQRW